MVKDEFHFQGQDWAGLQKLDQCMVGLYLVQNWLAYLSAAKNLTML